MKTESADLVVAKSQRSCCLRIVARCLDDLTRQTTQVCPEISDVDAWVRPTLKCYPPGGGEMGPPFLSGPPLRRVLGGLP